MRLAKWAVVLLFVNQYVGFVYAATLPPVGPRAPTSPPVTPTEDESTQLVEWLARYGYLPSSDPSTGQLQAWTAVTQAVKAMQKFAGLKETGVADEDTLNLMHTPRCSLPDEDGQHGQLDPQKSLDKEKRNHRGKRGAFSIWTQKNINWRVRSYPASSALSREMIRSLVFYALRVWAEHTPLDFHEVGNPEGAELQVEFQRGSHGDGYPFDGAGGAVGHAFFPSDPDRAGGVHLDSEEDWAFRQHASEGTDLFTVLVHEFGHALGLSHSSSRRSVMRPYYQGPVGDPLHFGLGIQDREEITRLYGKRDQSLATESPGLVLQPHLRHRGHSLVNTHSNVVDRCTTSFDTVAKIRGEMFFFKGPRMWRVNSGGLVSGRGSSIQRLWRGLPTNLPPLQAVLERKSDHGIVFISGSQYWLFMDLSLQEGYPRPLSDLGGGGQEMEQGLVWDAKQGAIWGERRQTEERPGDSETWRELIREGVNGVTEDTDGSIYIFRGHLYWKFPYQGSAPLSGFPRALASDWLDCPYSPTSLPGVLSYSPLSGRQDFRETEKEREGDHGGRGEKKDLCRVGKEMDRDSDRGKDQLQLWHCPCLSKAPGSDLVEHIRVALLSLFLMLIF